MSHIVNYLYNTISNAFKHPKKTNPIADKILNDKKIITYMAIKNILNVSSNILAYASLCSFVGFLTTNYLFTIFNIPSESFSKLSRKCSMGTFGIFASNTLINVLEKRQLVSLIKELQETHPELSENDLANSTITLTDKKLKIVNNSTKEKTVVKFDEKVLKSND